MANQTSVMIKWRQLQVLWSKYKASAIEILINPQTTEEQMKQLRAMMIDIHAKLKEAEKQLQEYGLRDNKGNVVYLEPREK